MPQIAVRDLSGNEVETISLSHEVFAAPVNVGLMHQAVTRLRADQRAGTHKARTRSEVAGGGAKPWRQKGTGRARQGSRTSPIWRGGGVAFPPLPRSYAVQMPKKMRRAATRSALTSRVEADGILVVSSLQPAEPKTRAMAEAMQNLRATGSVLLVDETVAESTARSTRNLPGVEVKPASTLNILDVLNHDYLVFSVDGIRHIERILSNANA